MITRQEASDLIYAGVLGCLDRADQTKLNEYIDSGGELPPNMGELQNIAAMLPIILQAENPDPELKDKVARKLYRIKDEIRAKVITGSIPPAEVFYRNSRENRKAASTPEDKLSSSSDVEKNTQEPVIGEKESSTFETEKEVLKEEIHKEIKSGDFEPVIPAHNTFESFKSTREKVLEGNFDDTSEEKVPEEVKPEVKIPTREKIKTYEREITKEKPSYKTSTKETPYKITSTKERGKSFERAYKKKYMTEETSNKEQRMKPWIMLSLFIILLLALIVLYLNFSSEINNLKFTNDTLKQQINDLSVKFNSTQEIQSILESPDVKVINLQGTGINPVGRGKLIISGSQSKGYIQLSDMPALGQNSSYQLWMQLPDGKYFSLGVFNPSGRVQYFPFKIPRLEENNIAEFMVTEESSTGAADPGNKVFLTGSLQ
jgi:anti-sigma-K factor RskA